MYKSELARYAGVSSNTFRRYLNTHRTILAEMGVAPYDAIPSIITKKVTSKFPKIPKMAVRMTWDFAAILIGTLVGGVPIIGIILMAIFLGPAITLVGKVINKSK